MAGKEGRCSTKSMAAEAVTGQHRPMKKKGLSKAGQRRTVEPGTARDMNIMAAEEEAQHGPVKKGLPKAGQPMKKGVSKAGKMRTPKPSTTKTKAAAGCSGGEKAGHAALAAVVAEPADAVAPTAGEKSVAAGGDVEEEDDAPTVYVFPQKTVDYILSPDFAEPKTLKRVGEADYEDYYDVLSPDEIEAFKRACEGWNDACDFYDKTQARLVEYKKEVRLEYEAKGYVEVDKNYAQRRLELQAAAEAVLREAGISDDDEAPPCLVGEVTV